MCSDKVDLVIADARCASERLRELGEVLQADRVDRLIRSRIASKAENSRIHAAVKRLPDEVAVRILKA